MKERAMVPRAEPRSYYGQPILKQPVWTWEIPTYFFFGGLAGSSAGLAYAAGAGGHEELSRRAWAVSLGALAASPPLLISDLGRPERFLNMLRMLKVTSPMSVGTWVLSAAGPAIGLAATGAWTSFLPPALPRVAAPIAATLGLPLATYTAALVADTSVPAWHEARTTLPFVFAASSAASAGAAATLATPAGQAEPARRLALAGAVGELAAARLMEHRLGDAAGPYRSGPGAKLSRLAAAATAGGAALMAAGTRRRPATLAGAGLLLAGAMAERWSVFKAGQDSARDPRYVVGPQRERVASR